MKTGKSLWTTLSALLVAASLILASCAPTPTATSTRTPTRARTPTRTPTATPIPLPAFSLEPGQLYFSVDGQPGMVYSRNVAAFFPEDYGTELDWSVYGGTRVIRFGLVNIGGMGGYPYTNTGELNEEVVRNFESLIDDAEAHGLYVLPWLTGWGEWNTTGSTDWANNPFNAANGGPAQDPTEVFQEGTPANTMWFEYVSRLVARWRNRDNILAWEVLGEANLVQGITERQGMAFVEKMAEVIHAADPQRRPITASLGDVGTWPNFYTSEALDFIQIHPYRPDYRLDRDIVDLIHQYLAAYDKPVLIGESGLNFEPMDDDWITGSPNAHIAVEHAVWAGVVSGSMNARALYWEDSYGLYFGPLRWGWLSQYAELELPAARFTNGVDFTGFAPVTVHYPSGTKVWGAAVGNEASVIGWLRDSQSEPPNWNLLPLISGQSVTLDVPGPAADWQVDFYDPKTGVDVLGSLLVSRQGNQVTIPLPDFTDAIAFKMYVNATGAIIPPPTPPALATAEPISADSLTGEWTGSVFGDSSDFAAVLDLNILPGCHPGGTCGSVAFEWCSLDLILSEIDGDTLVFLEQDVTGRTPACQAGGTDRLQVQRNGTILFHFEPGPSQEGSTSTGVLHRP